MLAVIAKRLVNHCVTILMKIESGAGLMKRSNSISVRVVRKLGRAFSGIIKKIKASHKKTVLERLSKNEPIFILGVQKSGTTAVAALLSEATRLPATLDIIRSIKRPYSKILRNYGIEDFGDYIYRYRREFSRKIIKEPSLTFDYQDLRAYFPKARFVIIIREPKDNIRSILNRLKVPGDLKELNTKEWPELNSSGAWRLNIDSSWLGHWPESYVDSLAYRWQLSAQIYFKNIDDFVLLRYEDFCQDKTGKITKLAEDLGLQVMTDFSDMVDSQFQPKGERVENYDVFYKENMLYIYKHCSEYAKKLGY